MEAYPLQSITIEEAQEMQFKLVDAITYEFNGFDILTLGDLGVHPALNQPQTTRSVERVFARFFDAEDACLVRGAGTGAIREALASKLKANDKILVHSAPVYTTTITTLELIGLECIVCDFNSEEDIIDVLSQHTDIKGALVQYTRQQLNDSYDMNHVISIIRSQAPSIHIVTDDNYAVMKVSKIGAQLGADASCFSLFKLLGPEGIGCVVGTKETVERIRSFHYSGGTQVQGHEALNAMKSLVYAPVSLAIQAGVIERVAERVNRGEVSGISEAVVVNAQSKVVLVKFDRPIAKTVLKETMLLGAAAYPVGAESKYEVVPMFYRVSGTMLKSDSEFAESWIRINPMRSGSDTVLRILKEAVEKVA